MIKKHYELNINIVKEGPNNKFKRNSLGCICMRVRLGNRGTEVKNDYHEKPIR